MTTWQIILIIGLLTGCLSALVSINRQLARLIDELNVHHRDFVLRRSKDDLLRFELEVFLQEANKATHAETRRQVDEFLKTPGGDEA